LQIAEALKLDEGVKKQFMQGPEPQEGLVKNL
jgi:hypothetical protein